MSTSPPPQRWIVSADDPEEITRHLSAAFSVGVPATQAQQFPFVLCSATPAGTRQFTPCRRVPLLQGRRSFSSEDGSRTTLGDIPYPGTQAMAPDDSRPHRVGNRFTARATWRHLAPPSSIAGDIPRMIPATIAGGRPRRRARPLESGRKNPLPSMSSHWPSGMTATISMSSSFNFLEPRATCPSATSEVVSMRSSSFSVARNLVVTPIVLLMILMIGSCGGSSGGPSAGSGLGDLGEWNTLSAGGNIVGIQHSEYGLRAAFEADGSNPTITAASSTRQPTVAGTWSGQWYGRHSVNGFLDGQDSGSARINVTISETDILATLNSDILTSSNVNETILLCCAVDVVDDGVAWAGWSGREGAMGS